MKHKLNDCEVSIIKLDQGELVDLIRETIFEYYKDYGNISNKKVVTSIVFKEENDNRISLIACFQNERQLYIDSNNEIAKNMPIDDIDEKYSLSKTPLIIEYSEIQKIKTNRDRSIF